MSRLGFDLYTLPIGGYELLTAAEANKLAEIRWSEPPLWSEVLIAPKGRENGQPRETKLSGPKVVTFYSFKGGVGRTTALALVALALARAGRRVAAVDLDLEAPGLASTFNVPQTQLGALDYLHRRRLSPDTHSTSIKECLYDVPLSETKGRLWIVPAGVYDEDYIHRLADLDVSTLYRRDPNPLRQLLDDLGKHLKPDVVLLDSRTGFNDLGAVALLDLADLAFIFFTPSEQSHRGLRWVVAAARRQYQRQSRPELRFVLSPLPPPSTDPLNPWLAKAESLIAELWDGTTKTPPVYKIRYSLSLSMPGDLIRDTPPEATAYEPLAEAISPGSFPRSPRDNGALDKTVAFKAAGTRYEISGREVLKKARKAMATRLPRQAPDIQRWAVEVDGQRLSVRWLFHEVTNIPLKDVTQHHALGIFKKMGLRLIDRGR
ncbi:MAG: AAA family ATPase [Chloroflexi bacterium]|nr:AAA family ATPase [Chloroflexota bacterium]